MNTIAQRLKAARLEKGWSQTHLAAEAGVSQSAIGNIESGLRQRPRDLVALARAVGVLPEWLETGTGQRTVTSDVAHTQGAGAPARQLVEQLVAIALPHRATLRKNLASLLVDLLENPEDDKLVEQTISDIERFYK